VPYSQTTLAQFTADISAALLDTANVYWTVDEIERAIRESLLVWGALTSYWRERGIFNTSATTAIYDLSQLLPTLRSRVYTFDQLTREVQYHFYEPSSGVVGTGMSTQFTIGQIVAALGRARNQFVIDARLPIADLEVSGILPNPPSGRTPLPQQVVALSHLWWQDAPSGIWYPLRKIDAWAEDSYIPAWPTQSAIPFAYSTAEMPPLEVGFYPIPGNSGAISAFALESEDYTATPIDQFTGLLLPDEFSAAVKYGAMYSVLNSDNEAFDPLRAQYAKQRYTSLTGAANALMRSVIRTQIGSVPIPLDTVANLDSARPQWRNIVGTPNFAACAYDLLVFAPTPNAQYSVSCDVVRSAPVPLTTNTLLQVGPEELPYLFDYCRHILSFKLGGAEFTATMPLYDNFLAGAKQRNSILTAKSEYLTPLFGQSRKEADLAVPA